MIQTTVQSWSQCAHRYAAHSSADDTQRTFEDEQQKPFAAYIVERDGKMILDGAHIFYNNEHYFWQRDSVPSVISLVYGLYSRPQYCSVAIITCALAPYRPTRRQ
jgi:hypothetical protein